MFKRIDHVELTPSDIEKTINFYTDVLGFQMKSRHEVNMPPLKEIVYMTLGDTMVEFLGVEKPEQGVNDIKIAGYKSIAIEVDNMGQAVEFLKSKGIDIAWGPVDVGGSIRAEIRDPDGFTIELRQW